VNGNQHEPDSPKESPAYATYDAALESLLEWLIAIEEQLTNWELEIALNGSWKEWSKVQSVGTVFEFSTTMFFECDDDVVRHLERARLELTRVVRCIEDDGQFR
jgi:hypothetical protein